MPKIRVDDCPAGPALDAGVVEAMGLEVFGTMTCYGNPGYEPGLLEPIRHYSEDIAAAWELVMHLVDNGYCVGLLFDDNGHWALSTGGMQNVPLGNDPEDICTSFFIEVADWADTAPLAIARAFLKANGIEEIDVEP